MDVKVVLIGDRGVGKGALVERYMGSGAASAGLLEVNTAHVRYKGTLVQVSIWTFNAKKMEGAKCTRAEAMSHALLVKSTFEGVACILHCIDLSLGKAALMTVQKWQAHVRSLAGDVPYILVGCKSDIQCEAMEGESFGFDDDTLGRVAKKLSIHWNRSCSAVTGKGVKELFSLAVTVGADHVISKRPNLDAVQFLGEDEMNESSSEGSWDSGDEEDYLAERKRKQELRELKPQLDGALAGMPEELAMAKEILEKIKGYVEKQ